jgi:hypothetical protein
MMAHERNSFDMVDLQQFYNRCPEKVSSEKRFLYNMSRDKDGTWAPHRHFTYQDYQNAWSEYDAVHYLLQYPFTVEGERLVAHVEDYYQIGWVPYGERFNGYIKQKIIFDVPISRLKILETAEQLRELY